MRYLTKGRFQKVLNVWFEDSRVKCTKGIDIVKYYGVRNARKDSGSVNEQKTLITNLLRAEDEVFSDFANNTRNEIRRAERDGITFSYDDSEFIEEHREILSDFAKMYNEMYAEKGLKTRIGVPDLLPIVDSGGLLVTGASHGKQVLVYHVYITDWDSARLLYSCSNFRIKDKEMQKTIGRVNRLLHWKDMIFLKSEGVRVYDWGGVSSFDEPNGIDKFKSAFGGKRVTYYNLTDTISAKAKIMKATRR